MYLPKLIYAIICLWLVLRGVQISKENKMQLFYGTTKVLGPHLIFKSRRVKKHVNLLSVHWLLSGMTIIQRSSLPFILILLANDIETNPGPICTPRNINASDNSDLERNMSLVSFLAGDNTRHGNRELVIHLNCRSLLPKVDELRAVFDLSKPLFIAATETWLNNNIPDTEVNINEYCIERNDRNSRGGGVALYVKNGMKYERKLQLEDPDNETICIEVKLRRNLPCLIICAYRAPDKPIAPFIDYLDDVTREVLRSGKQIVIVGDLNCDYLNNSSPQTKALKEFLDVYKLTQLIHEPTRSTFTSQSLIDLLITSAPELFSSAGIIQSGFSDHSPIFGYLNLTKISQRNHRIINSRKIDLCENHESFRHSIDKISWDMMNIYDDTNVKLSIWEQLFTPIMNHFFPVRRKRIRKNTHPWINRDILSLMRVRDQARRRAWKTKSEVDFSAYKRLRNRVTSSLRKAKLDYFQRELDGSKGDPKSFWKLMKNVLPPNNQSTKVEKLVVDGVDITDSKGICDSLNSYFTSIAKDLLSTRNSTSALLASNPQYETISTPTLQSPTSNSVLH